MLEIKQEESVEPETKTLGDCSKEELIGIIDNMHTQQATAPQQQYIYTSVSEIVVGGIIIRSSTATLEEIKKTFDNLVKKHNLLENGKKNPLTS